MAKRETITKPQERTYKAAGGGALSFEQKPEGFEFDYTTPGPHCRVDRLKQGRCATQLNFENGRPILRMCGSYGKTAKTVPVSSPQDALRKAQKFCRTSLGEMPASTPATGRTSVWPFFVGLGGALVASVIIRRSAR